MSAYIRFPEGLVHIGGDDAIPMVHTEPDGVTPVNITGWTLECVLRTKPTASTATLTVVPTVTSGTLGTYTVPFTDANTASLQPDTYFFTIRRTDDGSETIMARGTLPITAVSTR